MKIIVWSQSQPNFYALNSAFQILAQNYGQLEMLGVVQSSGTGGGGWSLTLGGKALPIIDKNSLPAIDFDVVLVTEQDNSFGIILEEARRLNLDINKFILDRTICIYGFSLEHYQKLRQSRLSIISMNIFGALIGYSFGLPNSGVNFSFSEKDFLKFLSEPMKYLREGLKFDKTTKNFLLGDIELNTTYTDENIARMAWHNWLVNFNPFNTLVVMYTEKPEVLAEFDKLPYAKKVCFVPFETNLDSGFYVKPYYVGGRSFEAAINKIAMNQITCLNLWDILIGTKKTPVNLRSNSLSKEIRPSIIFSSPSGNIHYFNWSDLPKNPSKTFFEKFIENNVGYGKNYDFFNVFGDHRFIRKYDAKNKIFHTEEEVFTWPWYDGYQDYCLDSVKLALGYEYLDNEKYIRLPLWMIWRLEPKLDMNLIKNKIASINAARSTCKYECVVINSHDMMNTRTPIYEKLKDVIQIKCAGKWNNNTDELQTIYGNDKLKYVHEFKFNICPENVNRYGYVTEKIFDSFIAGSIPIYYGSDNNPEEGVINKNAVLFWNPDSDNEALVKEVIRLKTDENYYQKFMSQEKLYAQNAAEFIYSTFEKLVKKLREM